VKGAVTVIAVQELRLQIPPKKFKEWKEQQGRKRNNTGNPRTLQVAHTLQLSHCHGIVSDMILLTTRGLQCMHIGCPSETKCEVVFVCFFENNKNKNN